MTFAERRFIKSLAAALITLLSSCGDTASEDSIRNYIANHPEEIIASVMKYRDQGVRRMEQQQSARIKAAANHFSEQGGVVFNPTGKLDVLEIVDYNCAFCKASFPNIKYKLNKEWKDVRFKIIPLPILGSNSESAILLTRVENSEPGSAASLMNAFMGSRERVDDNLTLSVAKRFHIDMKSIKDSSEWRAASEALKSDWSISERISIKATPSFIVNGKIIIGYEEEKLAKAIAEARDERR